jgi:hypothetical protein
VTSCCDHYVVLYASGHVDIVLQHSQMETCRPVCPLGHGLRYTTISFCCSHPVCCPKQISRFLGAGGYGEVYLCKWASVDVAVKCLSPSLLGPSLMMDAAGSNRPLPSDAVSSSL